MTAVSRSVRLSESFRTSNYGGWKCFARRKEVIEMRYCTGLIQVLLVMVVGGAALAATASAALPLLLGWESKPNWSGSKSGAESAFVETLGKAKITCTEASGTGVQTSDTVGSFHITFKSCESSGFKCNTEGDATGVILSLGTANYVDDHLSTNVNELGVAILLAPEEVTVKCTAVVTIRLKGTVLCLVLEPLASMVTHIFHCTQTAGDPADKEWFNDEGTKQTPSLVTSVNGSAFEGSALLMLATIVFAEPVAFMSE
ncbi:MAG: hypothetical protein E7812_08750 [Phenylobacterium sp.]|nr:MAG: hypothetical protein E7812_08750 [Phenylobacterium sp.]